MIKNFSLGVEVTQNGSDVILQNSMNLISEKREFFKVILKIGKPFTLLIYNMRKVGLKI